MYFFFLGHSAAASFVLPCEKLSANLWSDQATRTSLRTNSSTRVGVLAPRTRRVPSQLSQDDGRLANKTQSAQHSGQ